MKKLLPIATCMLLWGACNDDMMEPVQPQTVYQRITLSEVIESKDAQTVHWSQEFRFSTGQIIGSSITQHFGTNEE